MGARGRTARAGGGGDWKNGLSRGHGLVGIDWMGGRSISILRKTDDGTKSCYTAGNTDHCGLIGYNLGFGIGMAGTVHPSFGYGDGGSCASSHDITTGEW